MGRLSVLSLILTIFSGTYLSNPCHGQVSSKCDLTFINHLVTRADYKEAKYLLQDGDCLNGSSRDSVNFFLGWCLYSTKELLPSATAFLKIDRSSSFYLKARFYAAYNYAHSGFPGEATDILDSFDPDLPRLISLKNLEKAGISLLQKDFPSYDRYIETVDTGFFELSSHISELDDLKNKMMYHRSKSPLAGGLMSAIIPGSGKFYSGNKGGAVASFISTAGFGAVTYENFRKRGLDDFRTIAFGTAFLVSYISGIFGTVVSVNLLNSEYDENVRNTILFNIHIPVRNIFNE